MDRVLTASQEAPDPANPVVRRIYLENRSRPEVEANEPSDECQKDTLVPSFEWTVDEYVPLVHQLREAMRELS